MAAGTGTGVAPAVAIVALHAALSAYTYSLVGRAVAKTGAANFGELWDACFSPKTSWVIDVMIMGVAGGACLTYGCFLGDLLAQLSGGAVGRTAAIVGLACFPIAPLALLKNLSALKHSSMAGLAAIAVSACVVVKRAVDGTYGAPAARFGSWLAGAGDPLVQVSSTRLCVGTCVLFNMLSTAFMCHTSAVRATTSSAQGPPRGRRAQGLRPRGAALRRRHARGLRDLRRRLQGVDSVELRRLRPARARGGVATLVSLLSSHPLLFTSFRDATFSLFKATVDPLLAKNPANWNWLTLLLLAVPTSLAIVLPDVGFVVSLMGASLGAGLIIVIPGLFGTSLGLANSAVEARVMKLVTYCGVGIGIFGTVVTCLETYTDLLN
ncbi:hypothetical protein JL721_9302 [Aureococcus anophagefferens]|nr:hypothetical protein JL721_9302 [Aureococcus anophagefferens]